MHQSVVSTRQYLILSDVRHPYRHASTSDDAYQAQNYIRVYIYIVETIHTLVNSNMQGEAMNLAKCE